MMNAEEIVDSIKNRIANCDASDSPSYVQALDDLLEHITDQGGDFKTDGDIEFDRENEMIVVKNVTDLVMIHETDSYNNRLTVKTENSSHQVSITLPKHLLHRFLRGL